MAFGDDQVKFARQAADSTYDAVLGFFGDKGRPGATAALIAGILSGLVLCSALIVTVVLGLIFRIGSQVVAIFLTTLEEVRHDNQDSLNTALAAALSDLLSVPVDGSDLPSGGDPQAQLLRAQAIGEKVHSLLENEFGGNNGPDGVDGALAARAFTGFNINFNTGAAILGILGEISSLGYFKEFREVGELVAQGLSLGRLHRQALRPLIDHLIAKPYDRQLGAKYRQARLTDQQYINAWFGGLIDEDALTKHLQEKGYTDTDIDNVKALLPKKISPSDAAMLDRFGELGGSASNLWLRQAGYSEPDAARLQRIDVLTRMDTLQGQYVHDAYILARDRHISEADFQQVMDSTKLAEEEKQLWAQRLSLHILHPTKRISLAQLVYLGEHTQINDGDVDRWIEAEGYDAEDAGLISLYVLGKELDFEAAQALKAKKAADAAKKLQDKQAAAAAKANTTTGG